MDQRPKSTKRLDLKWLECPTLPRQSSSTSVTPFFFPIGSGFTLRSTSTTSSPLKIFCVELNAGQRPRSTLFCSKAAQQTMVFGTCSTPTCSRSLVCNRTDPETAWPPPLGFRPIGELCAWEHVKFSKELASDHVLGGAPTPRGKLRLGWNATGLRTASG